MPTSVVSESDLVTAKSIYETGGSCHDVAIATGVSRATAWRMKHQALLDPTLIAHASKTIGDKMLLGATAAMDTFLDKAEAGELKECSPSALIKMASTAVEASAAYAAHCGAQSFLSDTLSSYGIGSSHSVSRVTLEQRVTVETGKPDACMRTVQAAVQAAPDLRSESTNNCP